MTVFPNSAGIVEEFLKYRGTTLARNVEAHAANDPYSDMLIREYVGLVNHAIDERGYGASLFRVSPEMLRSLGAIILVVRSEESNAIRVGLHVAPDEDGEFNWLSGLVKAENENSAVVPELIARTLMWNMSTYGPKTKVRACWRLFPPGYRDKSGRRPAENKGSRQLFERFEFEVIQEETVPIKGTLLDAHLLESSEPDGRSFRVKVAESTELSFETARLFLSMARAMKGAS